MFTIEAQAPSALMPHIFTAVKQTFPERSNWAFYICLWCQVMAPGLLSSSKHHFHSHSSQFGYFSCFSLYEPLQLCSSTRTKRRGKEGAGKVRLVMRTWGKGRCTQQPPALGLVLGFGRAAWAAGRCPCPWKGWDCMGFKVPANSTHSQIL